MKHEHGLSHFSVVHHGLRGILAALVFAGLGCGGDSADSASNGEPGNNVGFGGAQDIGQFRDILDRGEIPGVETLDANGFFSEHRDPLPPAECGDPLCLHAMLSLNRSWVNNDYQAVMRIALNTNIDASAFADTPRDFILVIDTSGSMLADDRLDYVKQGAKLLIENLKEDDRLALVSYESEASIVSNLGEHSKEGLLAIVDGLRAGGGTNIYDGLQAGMGIASENLSVDRASRVILLSDGNITVGQDSDAVMQLASVHVEEGVGLTTIGVGDQFNVELMRGLAEQGAGNFYYVEDAPAIVEVFTEEVDYFSQPIALGLEVAVTTDSGHTFGEVLGSNLWVQRGAQEGDIYVPALFLASRGPEDPNENGRRGGGSSLFVQMNPSASTLVDSRAATVVASYRIPGTGELVTQEIEVRNPFPETPPDVGYVSHVEMLPSYASYNVFLGLRQASEEAEYNYDCAALTLSSLQSSLQGWGAEQEDLDLSYDEELINQFSANLLAKGAIPERCDGDYWPDGAYGEDYVHYGCSLGGKGEGARGGALFVLFALVFVARSRSRLLPSCSREG